MTSLAASIEKMKVALYSTARRLPTSHGSPQLCQEALDAAPAQAMTEDEIVCLISYRSSIGSREVFRALLEAGVLYCKEGK